MTVLINTTLNTNVAAGTAAFTSITGFGVGTLTPANSKYSKVQVTLTPATVAVNLVLNSLWMGHVGAGDPYDFDGNQVQLKVGGSGTITLITSGADVVCDIVNFNLDTAKALLFAYDGASNASARDIRRSTAVAGCTVYFGGGVQGSDAATTNKSGYSTSTVKQDLVAKIEGFSTLRSFIGIPIIG